MKRAKTLYKNENSVSYNQFIIFKSIGLISSSERKRWLMYSLSVLLILIMTLSSGILLYIEGFRLIIFGIMYSNVVFSITGTTCVVMNQKLSNQYQNIFLNKELESPKRKYVILIAFICFVLCEFTYFLQQLETSSTLAIVGYVGEHVCSIIAEIQILSFLFMLGCVITHYTNYLKEIVSDRDSLLIFSVKKAIENYHLLQNSVSVGLLLIFSLQTVNLAFFIYINIKNGLNPVPALWNVNMIVILVYIALVADDVNQARLGFVDNLW